MNPRVQIPLYKLFLIVAAWAAAFRLFLHFPLFGGPILLAALGSCLTWLIVIFRRNHVGGVAVVVTTMSLVAPLAYYFLGGQFFRYGGPGGIWWDNLIAPELCVTVGGVIGLILTTIEKPPPKPPDNP
jgi:hypothetical protein